jgi:hypothetical protein
MMCDKEAIFTTDSAHSSDYARTAPPPPPQQMFWQMTLTMAGC